MKKFIQAPFPISGCTLQDKRKKWLKNRFPKLKGKVKALDEVSIKWVFEEEVIIERIINRRTQNVYTFDIAATKEEQKEVMTQIMDLYQVVSYGNVNGMTRTELERKIRNQFKDLQSRREGLTRYNSCARISVQPNGDYYVSSVNIGYPRASQHLAVEISRYINRNKLKWAMHE